MPRRLGKRTSKEEMERYAKEWGLRNPPPDWKVMALHKKGLTAGQIARELGTTSTYVEGTIARLNPVKGKFVEARPSFKFAWEKIADWDKIKKEHPSAIIRTVTAGDHVLRIAYWD